MVSGGEGTKVKVSLTVDTQIYEDFKKYCERNGMKMSSKIEQLMKKTIKNTTLQAYIKKE